jgi:RNA polymerase sigma-70 factor, ECF subfamily
MLGVMGSWIGLVLGVVAPESDRQGRLYREASQEHGAAMERLARGYERQDDRRRDLLQEIHVALWRSFAGFDGRCSVRTWVYRVAHNVATSRVAQDRRARARPSVSLSELEVLASSDDTEAQVGERRALERLLGLVQQLPALERQLTLLYLEGLEAASIAEVTGLSSVNVATKIHRIKQVLARHFEGDAVRSER